MIFFKRVVVQRFFVAISLTAQAFDSQINGRSAGNNSRQALFKARQRTSVAAVSIQYF
jgi:hypothetical protein